MQDLQPARQHLILPRKPNAINKRHALAWTVPALLRQDRHGSHRAGHLQQATIFKQNLCRNLRPTFCNIVASGINGIILSISTRVTYSTHHDMFLTPARLDEHNSPATAAGPGTGGTAAAASAAGKGRGLAAAGAPPSKEQKACYYVEAQCTVWRHLQFGEAVG